MIVYPAIDILDGKAVRLRRGDFSDSTQYADDPLDAARRWAEEGARALHVVDLDGAREGQPASLEHLSRICDELSIPVQYGGGLRSLGHLRQALDAGADRVVLGTAAFADGSMLNSALESWPGRVAVAVDVRDGQVSTSGWTKTTQTTGAAAVNRLLERGVRAFVYTNIDRDGMLTGPDLEEIARVSQVVGSGRFLYSGGIGSLDDVRALADLGLENLAGVIIGKALYEGRFSLAGAMDMLASELGARPSRSQSQE